MTKAELEQQFAALQADVSRLTEERERYRELYLQMLETCRKLERGLLGQKAEKLPPDEAQLSLQVLATLLKASGTAPAPKPETKGEATEVKGHKRRKPTGRKPLPDHLPRIDIEVVPPEVQQEGLDAFARIGEEVSEVVERRRASLVVVRTTRPKFARKEPEPDKPTVVIAQPPELPIARGLAGPGLLAESVVQRWEDHLPLHRLEGIYARDGLDLARSTICGWHEQLAEQAKHIIDAMWVDARKQPYLCTDATGVLVQAKERCRTGHFWVVVAPERHVLFGYSKKHNGEAIGELLGDFEGYLVADAHSVYDHLYRERQITEVACWAHCRRYFFKALSSDPDRAREALALLGALFGVEREVAKSPRKKRARLRRKRAGPIVKRFFAWCAEHKDQVLDDTPIARAIEV